MERDSAGVKPGQRDGWSHLVFDFPLFGMEPDRCLLPGLAAIKGVGRRDAMGFTYGTWALLGFAAAPLPQTPALIFTAVSRLPVSEVFLALFLGKLLKYGVYGWLAAEFPSWFQHLAAIGEHKYQTRT